MSRPLSIAFRSNHNLDIQRAWTTFNVSLVILLVAMPYFLRFWKHKYNPLSYVDSQTYVRRSIYAFIVVCPWIISKFPFLRNDKWQLAVAVTVLLLDWGSFLQDMTRFSEVIGKNDKGAIITEEEKIDEVSTPTCVTNSLFGGNCRLNAKITGLGAHIADAVGVGLLMLAISPQSRNVIIVAMALYTIVGGLLIWAYTSDGGSSDLRGLSDTKKCKKTCEDGSSPWDCLWSNDNRGWFNLVITFLGVLAGWQGIMQIAWPEGGLSLGDAGGKYKFNAVTGFIPHFWKFVTEANSENRSTMRVVATVAIAIGMGLGPTVFNEINTSYQYGAEPKDMNLPACFD